MPPLKADEAPQWSTPLILQDGQLVLMRNVHANTGAIEYAIVGAIDGITYVRSDTAMMLIPWLIGPALAWDNS